MGRLPEYREREGIVQEVLLDDYACVVVRVGHPIVSAKPSLAELLNWRWILPRQETTLRQQIDETFRSHNLQPPANGVESVSVLVNRALLLGTDCVAVWPVQLARHEARSGRIAILPLELPNTLRPIGISTRSRGEISPTGQLLVTKLREVAREIALIG